MAKTIWLIWDGASYPLVADLLQRGVLPHLQRVVARGGLAAMAPPGPNSETPPGLMTLFTGCEEPDQSRYSEQVSLRALLTILALANARAPDTASYCSRY